ncbi:glycosyltransferase family 4 protein [Chloroflexota bacterium]
MGGTQVHLGRILRELKDQFSFTVAVLGRGGRYSDEYRALGIPVLEIGKQFGKWNPRPVGHLCGIVRDGRFDLIHASLFKSSILGAVAAWRTGCRFILQDKTGIHPRTLRHHSMSRITRFLYLRAYQFALGQCDRALVLTSEDKRAYLEYYSIRSGKINVIPNGIDMQEFGRTAESGAGANVRRELRLPPDTKVVMMAARLESVKEWPTFLQVARRVQSRRSELCAFLVVGSGPEKASLVTRARSQEMGNVHFLGFRDDMATLLAQADVFLLTSRRESFGIVILEAMAAGCPVVSTRSGGPQTILTHGVDGLLAEVGDVSGLAAHVDRLLREDDLRRLLVRNARQTLLERYSIDVAVARLAEVYGEVLGL